MALLIDKGAAVTPRPPHSPPLNGFSRGLKQAAPVMAAAVLSLWRKDRKSAKSRSLDTPSGNTAPPEPGSRDDWRRRVFDDGPIGVAVLDSTDCLVESNAAFQTLVGAGRTGRGQPLDAILKTAEAPI